MKKRIALFVFLLGISAIIGTAQTHAQEALLYPIVDTGQTNCFSNSAVITCGDGFNGQDAQYAGLQPSYQINGDGTVTDLNTGLMWQQNPGPKVNYQQAVAGADSFTLAGYDDWRLPSIRELYSLMNFNGVDSGPGATADNLTPFIDASIFGFAYGDESAGQRLIDSQWATSTLYNATVMGGNQCFFGVNFADGRIKCYPTMQRPGGSGGYFVRYVRGNAYGMNDFVDNGNSTITDRATGLTWMQNDSGQGLLWADALAYCENLSLAGSDNWRLPDIKELHSIVDYTRSPDVTNSPAIDALFSSTGIINEAGQPDFAFYWSSTTHMAYPNRVGNAAYIAFGRATGNMEQFGGWIDAHGAGSQRADPKDGVPANEVNGFGPQGDSRRSNNMVRCVTGGPVQPSNGASAASLNQASDTTTAVQPPPQNGQQGPPPEAFSACAGATDGAVCSVQTPRGTVSGVCRPFQEALACVPN